MSDQARNLSLDPRLADLLSTSIASVWGVEILLFMRTDTSRSWQRDALVSELRTSGLVVDQTLRRLERGGLVVREPEGSARFAPATVELSELVDRLAEEYRSRPDLVRRTIVSNPDAKLQSFSDAFMLRKPPQ